METNPVPPSCNVILLTELKIDPKHLPGMKSATLKYTHHGVLEFGVVYQALLRWFLHEAVSALAIMLESSVYFYACIPLQQSKFNTEQFIDYDMPGTIS